MLDIKWIRENQDAFVKGLTDRGSPEPRETLNQILSLDEQRRGTIQKLQEAQARRNAASKEIGQAKAGKDEASAKRLMDEVAALKATIQQGEADEKRLDDELRALLAAIPNVPAADVPVGDETANKELRKVGTPPKFDFQPKQHFELGEALGLMDFETAAKLSGSRFVVLKGALARLERALSQFMLDLHTSEHGYTEINPPLLVRDDAMFGTAQLPKFGEDQCSARGRLRIEKCSDATNAAGSTKHWRRGAHLRLTGISRVIRPRTQTLDGSTNQSRSALAHPHRRSAADESRARGDHRRGESFRSASPQARRASAPRPAPPARTRAA